MSYVAERQGEGSPSVDWKKFKELLADSDVEQEVTFRLDFGGVELKHSPIWDDRAGQKDVATEIEQSLASALREVGMLPEGYTVRVHPVAGAPYDIDEDEDLEEEIHVDEGVAKALKYYEKMEVTIHNSDGEEVLGGAVTYRVTEVDVYPPDMDPDDVTTTPASKYPQLDYAYVGFDADDFVRYLNEIGVPMTKDKLMEHVKEH